MPTSKLAIRELQAPPHRDLGELQQLPLREVNARLRSRGARWHTKPRWYQRVALLAGLKLTSCYIILDPGLGKTKVAFDLFLTRKEAGRVRRMLVLVPAVTNIEAWRQELAIHAPDLKYAGLDHGSRVQKEELVTDENAEVVCMTYAGWLALTHRRTRSAGYKLDKRRHDALAASFDMVVWDEATMLRGHMTKSFRAARRFLKLVPYRYALSGTPMDKNPSDFWAQFYMLDGGETLGKTLGLYRASFFREEAHPYKDVHYVFDTAYKKVLRRRLRNRSVRYRAKDCLDLPPLVGGMLSPEYMPLVGVWPDSTWGYYESLLQELHEQRDDPDAKENTYLRMRQLTAGFLSDGEGGFTSLTPNVKLDMLVDKLREIPDSCKAIVFNEYKHSGQLICERLKEEKLRHVRIYSGTNKRSELMRRFRDDPACNILVGSSSIAYGLNLQFANYILFYESPDETIIREQVERRIVRQGQRKKQFIYDLVIKNSVDVRVLRALRAGVRLRDELMRSPDPRKLLVG